MTGVPTARPATRESTRRRRSAIGLSTARTLSILGSAVLSGCGLVGADDESFLIRVDGVTGPDSVQLGAPLRLVFYGSIGPDQCWQLDRVERERTDRALRLAFFGVRRGSICLQMPSALEHAETVADLRGSDFTVEVRQPGGAILRKVVTIR